MSAFLRASEAAISSGKSIRSLLGPHTRQKTKIVTEVVTKILYRDRWSVLQFGKHKGKRVNEVNPGYLAWLSDQGWVWSEIPELGREIEEFLGRK